jgi:hypothetical protein
LIEIERDHNEASQKNAAEYSLPRHLDFLIAMMGEAQLLRTNYGSPSP